MLSEEWTAIKAFYMPCDGFKIGDGLNLTIKTKTFLSIELV